MCSYTVDNTTTTHTISEEAYVTVELTQEIMTGSYVRQIDTPLHKESCKDLTHADTMSYHFMQVFLLFYAALRFLTCINESYIFRKTLEANVSRFTVAVGLQ